MVYSTVVARPVEYTLKVHPMYGACPKNETCACSEGLTHHCTGAGGVGYEKILDWPPWKVGLYFTPFT